MTKKRKWLRYFGAVLLASAAPVVAGAKVPAAAKQTSASSAKKKTAKSKKKAKPRVVGQQAPTADRIREIQSALNREGALNSQPTGKWDAATVSAMQKYQNENGLAPTGKIDALTLQKLGLGSEIAGKGAPSPPTAAPGGASHGATTTP